MVLQKSTVIGLLIAMSFAYSNEGSAQGYSNDLVAQSNARGMNNAAPHGDMPPTGRNGNLDRISADEQRPLHASNGLASVGSAAWPVVRAYLWEACFKDTELFSGYAYSHLGGEKSDVLSFQLLIEKATWKQTAAESARS